MKFFNLLNIFSVSILAKTEQDSKAIWKGGKITKEVEQKWKDLLFDSSKGNKESYERFLLEIDSYLAVFCKKYLFNPSQLEDCKQECLMAIHKAKHTFDYSKPFGPWFFTIVRHKIIDQFRFNTKLKQREVLDVDYSMHRSADTAMFDIDLVLEKLLEKVGKTYSDAFRLTKLEGKSIEQTAEILNIKQSAVKVRVHRASKEIRGLIKKEFSTDYS